MNDTVTKLLDLVSEYAEHYAEDRKWGAFTADTTKARQALQDELTRLFTPLTDELLMSRWRETPVLDELDVELDVMDYRRLYEHFAAMHGITGEKNETT